MTILLPARTGTALVTTSSGSVIEVLTTVDQTTPVNVQVENFIAVNLTLQSEWIVSIIQTDDQAKYNRMEDTICK